MVINLSSLITKQEDRKLYDERHGGPFDRGSADSWYGRGMNPHYYTGDTSQSKEVAESAMTEAEILAYHAGYMYNEKFGGKKDYN